MLHALILRPVVCLFVISLNSKISYPMLLIFHGNLPHYIGFRNYLCKIILRSVVLTYEYLLYFLLSLLYALIYHYFSLMYLNSQYFLWICVITSFVVKYLSIFESFKCFLYPYTCLNAVKIHQYSNMFQY